MFFQLLPVLVTRLQLAGEMVSFQCAVESVAYVSALFRIDSEYVLRFCNRHSPLHRSHSFRHVSAYDIQRQVLGFQVGAVGPENLLKMWRFSNQSVLRRL